MLTKFERGPPPWVSDASILSSKPTDTAFSKRRTLEQVLLSTYVPSHERVYPSTGMVAPDLEGAQEFIHHWSPFSSRRGQGKGIG